MRARTVLIVTMSAAVVLAPACQPNGDAGGGRNTGTPSSPPSTTTATATSSVRSSDTSTTSTPVRTVFDREQMQTSVLRVLADVYGIDGIEMVTCPSGQEVVDGATFQCTVVINGVDKQVTITVRGNDGKYVVSRPE